MKRLTSQLMIAAATLVVAAGSASAQNLKAEIPFTFRVGNTVMAPGSYEVRADYVGGSRQFILQNQDTSRSVLLAMYTTGDVSKEWKAEGTAKLGFTCADERCSLSELWTGDDTSMYQFPAPKLGRDDARTAEIGLTHVKAD